MVKNSQTIKIYSIKKLSSRVLNLLNQTLLFVAFSALITSLVGSTNFVKAQTDIDTILQSIEDERKQSLYKELTLALPVYTDNPSYSMTFSDPSGKGVQLSLDGRDFESITSPFSMPSLGIGVHNVIIKYYSKNNAPQTIDTTLTIIPRSPKIEPLNITKDSISVNGTAIGDGIVTLQIVTPDEVIIQEIKANISGNWSYKVDRANQTGRYAITAYVRKDSFASNISSPSFYVLKDDESTNSEQPINEMHDSSSDKFTFAGITDISKMKEMLRNNPDTLILASSVLVIGTMLGWILGGSRFDNETKKLQKVLKGYINDDKGRVNKEGVIQSKPSLIDKLKEQDSVSLKEHTALDDGEASSRTRQNLIPIDTVDDRHKSEDIKEESMEGSNENTVNRNPNDENRATIDNESGNKDYDNYDNNKNEDAYSDIKINVVEEGEVIEESSVIDIPDDKTTLTKNGVGEYTVELVNGLSNATVELEKQSGLKHTDKVQEIKKDSFWSKLFNRGKSKELKKHKDSTKSAITVDSNEDKGSYIDRFTKSRSSVNLEDNAIKEDKLIYNQGKLSASEDTNSSSDNMYSTESKQRLLDNPDTVMSVEDFSLSAISNKENEGNNDLDRETFLQRFKNFDPDDDKGNEVIPISQNDLIDDEVESMNQKISAGRKVKISINKRR